MWRFEQCKGQPTTSSSLELQAINIRCVYKLKVMAVVSSAGGLTSVNLEVGFFYGFMLQGSADNPWLDHHLACCGHCRAFRHRALVH